MEIFEVDITDKKAKALLKQLEALGVIAMRPKKVRTLGQVIADMQAHALKLAPLSEAEIIEEIKAHRREKRSKSSARVPLANA